MAGRETPHGKTIDDVIHTPEGGPARDTQDHRRLRRGRDDCGGLHVGQYIQTPPFFFTRDGHGVPLCDMYRGSSAFLICGGPSFGKLDHSLLLQPGILTMGLNNSVKTFRPRLWCCVDDPAHYIRSIWLDPTLMKIVPFSHAEKPIFDSDAWAMMDKKVGDCPNVWFYRRNEYFVAQRYLFEDTINWGNHSKLGGARSVMLAAVRILFLLGIRRLYLLGADFHMAPDCRYHFEQQRTRQSIAGNNSTYRKLDARFGELRPIFERHGYTVLNCNPDSRLRAFDFVSYEEAVREARAALPQDLAAERTAGLYERMGQEPKAKEKAKAAASNRQGHSPANLAAPGNDAAATERAGAGSGSNDLREVKSAVRSAREALRDARARREALERSASHDNGDAADAIARLPATRAEVRTLRKRLRMLVRKRKELTAGGRNFYP